MWKVKEGKGRPEKITPEVVKKLKQIFMYDGSVEEACLYAWISKVTYYAKLKKDKDFWTKWIVLGYTHILQLKRH